MEISQVGLDLVKQFEGLKLKAYVCPAGVATIGYGTTRYPNGQKVRIGQQITEQEAEKYLEHDCNKFGQQILSVVTVTLNQNQFDALVSFVYNIGFGAFKTSTLLKVLNKKDYIEAGKQLLRWNKGGGRVLQGLVRRRQAEKKLFEKTGVNAPSENKMSSLSSINAGVSSKELNPEQIKELQQKLNAICHNLIVDGQCGTNTIKAFEEFKNSNGLSYPSLIGKTTVDYLNQLVEQSGVSPVTTPVNNTITFEANERYFLSYHQSYDKVKGQDYGELSLNCMGQQGEGKTLEQWRATSSTASKQGQGDYNRRGGLIPPHDQVKSLALSNGGSKTYMVNLNGYHLDTKGVEGMFYPIEPNYINTKEGGKRSEIGIHRDANVEGSMGCIVMPTEIFNNYRQTIDKYKAQTGKEKIALFVSYS